MSTARVLDQFGNVIQVLEEGQCLHVEDGWTIEEIEVVGEAPEEVEPIPAPVPEPDNIVPASEPVPAPEPEPAPPAPAEGSGS